jgi:high-affinity nickel-transport protein
MTGTIGIVALGFLLGMRHATDPDHVVAVSTIVSRHRSIRQAGLVGAAWGLGHTLTVFVVGGAIVLFGWVMPARLGLAMEFAVAVMLVLLGLGTIAGLRRHHRHERGTHSHAADDAVAWLDRRFDGGTLYMLVRPLLVGVVHGLAGSAAVALLVMSAIGDPIWALVYLGVFGLGTILGMMLITALIAMPFAMTAGRVPVLSRALHAGAGVASVLFGLVLAYQIGFVNGLFGPTAIWDPR